MTGPSFRSYSQLTTYKECPEQYRLKYIERIPEQPAIWSAGGTAFHQVAEWYLLGDVTERQIPNAWQAAWDLAVTELIDRGASPDLATWRAANRGTENAAWWMRHGLRMAQDFVEWRSAAGRSLVVLTEGDKRYLEARLEVEFGGVPVVAIPDWLAVDEHGQLDIVDYKSGKPPRQSYQLGFYRAAVKAALGLDATWGLYYMARDARVIPVDLARYDPEDVVRDVVEFDARVRLGQFEPAPGDHCKFCPFRAEHCTYYNPPEGA